MELVHAPIASGPNTGDREAWLVVNSNHPLGTGDGVPLLYYSVNGGSFTALQPSQVNPDTIWYMIPGQEIGSMIEYYLAAQNEDATLIATLPAGGRGVNPPGSSAPDSYLSYVVDNINMLTSCSSTLPKPINDLSNVYDTILVMTDGILLDLDVQLDITHTYTGDVEVYLIGPGGTEIKLSVGNGGSGNNFTGTTFDDEATIHISAGSAPFTGSYIPDEALSTFDDIGLIGNWVLRVYDNAMNDQGVLNNWCLNFTYSDPTGIHYMDNAPTILHQNYPNPFREETTFAFELPKPGDVMITIIDMMGRELETIVDQEYDRGEHSVNWNAGNLSAGQYLYRIQTDEHVEVKTMMIAK